MTEIKGQLLGLILLLTIFGAVSVGIAAIFANSRDTVTQKAENINSEAEKTLSVSDPDGI